MSEDVTSFLNGDDRVLFARGTTTMGATIGVRPERAEYAMQIAARAQQISFPATERTRHSSQGMSL